jgi:NAD+ kinase
MKKPLGSFGIVAFNQSAHINPVLNRIQAWGEASGASVYFHPTMTSRAPQSAVVCASEEDFLEKSEVIVSVGGDGTFLSMIHMCKFSGKPVVGVNMGGLGFLTDIAAEAVEEALQKIHSGNYSIIDRMMLEANVLRGNDALGSFHAFNDIFINRLDNPKLTSIGAWYGDQFITDFHSDGIIVATPSGSTAYSLSAGGPIIEPNVRAFLITPICPHSLTERPLILPCDLPIRFDMRQKNAELLLSADGLENIRLQSGDEVVITVGRVQAHLLQFSSRSYFDLLRVKLEWGKNYKWSEKQE